MMDHDAVATFKVAAISSNALLIPSLPRTPVMLYTSTSVQAVIGLSVHCHWTPKKRSKPCCPQGCRSHPQRTPGIVIPNGPGDAPHLHTRPGGRLTVNSLPFVCKKEVRNLHGLNFDSATDGRRNDPPPQCHIELPSTRRCRAAIPSVTVFGSGCPSSLLSDPKKEVRTLRNVICLCE